MARPRTPAKVLEIRGAFAAHPERARQDAPGAGPINLDPPEGLNGPQIAAWRRLAERLPTVALTSTEEVALERAAVIYAQLRDTHPASPDFKKLDDSLRQWLIQLGMTLQARTKLGTSGHKDEGNKFAEFKQPIPG